MKQPILETERLILRPYDISDAPVAAKLAGDKRISDVTTNIPSPYSESMAEDWISTHQSNWQNRKVITYAITLKQNDELVGTVSLSDINNNRANLGYWIGVPFWGNGYCTEAAEKLLTLGFNQVGLNVIYATHLSHNTASGNVMTKLGMQYIKEETITERQHRYYEITKEQWLLNSEQ